MDKTCEVCRQGNVTASITAELSFDCTYCGRYSMARDVDFRIRENRSSDDWELTPVQREALSHRIRKRSSVLLAPMTRGCRAPTPPQGRQHVERLRGSAMCFANSGAFVAPQT